MGASGSGKSTLMNILGCLDRPTSGEYLFDGREISRLTAKERARLRNRMIGFVFQSFNLLARMTAFENVLMPLMYCRDRLSEREMERRTAELLEKVGLADRPITGPPNSREVNSSVLRLPARLSTVHRCCLPMSRPAIWIRAPARRFSSCFSSSTRRTVLRSSS